jgi:hypothetical protein
VSADPLVFAASFDGKQIQMDETPRIVARHVADGDICILKGAFADSDKLASLRNAVVGWSQSVVPIPEPDLLQNCHCCQAGISRLQKTPHVYHSFNFNRLSSLPVMLRKQLTETFAALAGLHGALTGKQFPMEPRESRESGPVFHPQIIQYPPGGGLFGRHVHLLLPQEIGMITALTQRGVDFPEGETGFDTPKGVVMSGASHDLGDIVLFRYDLPHWVTPSDTADNFDWGSPAGRWSMVLPCY